MGLPEGQEPSSGDWSERTDADLASLLVELGRAVKGVRFYSGDARRDLIERAFLAICADLERAGPLVLRILDGGFQADGVPETVAGDPLRELHAGLQRMGVERVRIGAELGRDGLAAFAAELSGDGTSLTPQPGIDVDGRRYGDGGPAPASLGSQLVGAPPVLLEEEAKQGVEEQPLHSPASGPAGDSLLAELRTLDGCSEDDHYGDVLARVRLAAGVLAEQGAVDEAYRALIVLSDHAVGEGGRSAVQARLALDTLGELAQGVLLEDLLDRACAPEGGSSVRAARILLLLGERAAPRLLERLAASEPESTGSAAPVLIALGERAANVLARAIEPGRGPKARAAVRLAGEMQCPDLASPLRGVLMDPGSELQKDAAKALVQLGNAAAVEALEVALTSPDPRTAEMAAFCLGALAAPRALKPLRTRMRLAQKAGDWNLVREVVRSIAQFPEADAETATALYELVVQKGMPWKRPSLDLKLEAVTALGQVGGEPSVRVLRRIARSKRSAMPPRLRERAERILERRYGRR